MTVLARYLLRRIWAHDEVEVSGFDAAGRLPIDDDRVTVGRSRHSHVTVKAVIGGRQMSCAVRLDGSGHPWLCHGGHAMDHQVNGEPFTWREMKRRLEVGDEIVIVASVPVNGPVLRMVLEQETAGADGAPTGS